MSVWRKTACVSMAVVLVVTSLFAGAAMDDYMQGRLDGERDARGNPLWLVAGLGCAIFGVGAAYLIKPNPPASALVGKSAGYVMGYTEGYQNTGRYRNTMWACGGWAILIAIWAATLD